jgi:hypothetical protein
MKKTEINQVQLTLEPKECKILYEILIAAESENLTNLKHLKRDIVEFRDVLGGK